MLNVNKQRRFPRRKYWRLVDNMMYELDVWKRYYASRAALVNSVVLERKLDERLHACDNLWHELDAARETLTWLT